MKLHSLDEVRAMWPDPKPTERAFRRAVKAAFDGPKVSFNEADIERFLDTCSLRYAGYDYISDLAGTYAGATDESLKAHNSHFCKMSRKFRRCVYFILAGDKVKIGSASRLEKRLGSIQTGSPDPLMVVGFVWGAGNEERELHWRFHRHRYRGEWFRLCPEIEQFIAENSKR